MLSADLGYSMGRSDRTEIYLGRSVRRLARATRPAHALRHISELPTALAGERAFQRFCTPRLSHYRAPDHDALTERSRFHLRASRWETVETCEGPVQTFIFEPQGAETAPSVLIAHGWTSETSFMAVFAEQLRRAGFRVVAFDQPAHGKTGGERASLIDCARALRDVAHALGPIRFVVAHSMGSMASLLVGEGGAPLGEPYPFEGYVLVSPPNRFSEVTRAFGERQGLSARALADFEHRLERIAHRTVASFTTANMLERTGRPSLIMHCRDDADVEISEARAIAAQCPAATLTETSGLGHRNILFAPQVIRPAIAWLKARL